MTSQQVRIPEALFFRVYPTFIEASKEQLKRVNRNSYYRFSIYEGTTLLGEMVQGSPPAILGDKIFLAKAMINFSHKMQNQDLIISLSEHVNADRVLGRGTFNLRPIKIKYMEHAQRFYSMLEIDLTSQDGEVLKLVYSIFVERDRYRLQQYIQRFKQNERAVLRARRNINNYKRELHNRSIEQQKSTSSKRGGKTQHPKASNHIKIEGEDRSQRKVDLRDRSTNGPTNFGTYLEIQSAAKFHKKHSEKFSIVQNSSLNEIEEKELQAYSEAMSDYQIELHYVSGMDQGTISNLSDGSQESQMRAHNQTETYSEKAVKTFKQKVSKGINLLLVLLALSLIYFMIAPSRKFEKLEKGRRRSKKDRNELFDI